MTRLPGERFLLCSHEADDTLASSDIAFATSSVRSGSGKRAVTLKANCPVNEWFAFQSSPEDFEEWDQAALELVWTRLHQALPELGQDIEIIETANPGTFYEDTRRKLGMVMGIEQATGLPRLGYQTTLPNVFMIGDTISPATMADVCESALGFTTT
jgi:phytoene dehydrogenase-like protein